MANDLYINTHPLWGGEVTPGDQNIVAAEFQMIGRQTFPTSLTFESETGASVRDVARNPELRADLYGRDARGRLTLTPDGNFETLVARGSYSPDGDLTFRFGGIGTVFAHRGTDLQVQFDVANNAEDGMPVAFGLPTVGFVTPRLASRVYHIGYDNPVYVVDAIQDSHLRFDLDSTSDTFSPGDDDIVLATLNMASDEGAYVSNLFVGIEGRHRDGTLIPDVDRSVEDIELRDTLTGQVYHAIPVGEVNGLEIVRFEYVYVEGDRSLEIRMDQDGAVAQGDMFRAHVVVEPSSSANQINIGGLTGPTTDYRLQAGAFGNDRLVVSPGGILTGNFHAVDFPTLNVNVVSIGSTDTAVKNEKNINLVRFEARAGDAEDILFTDVSFVAEVGSALNVKNGTLWFDSDRDGRVDTIAQSGVSVTSGQFRFDSLTGGGIIVPAGESVMMEFHADVASSLTTTTLRMDIVASSVQAEDADVGTSLASSQIVVTSFVDSKLYNLVNQGDVFVTLDSTPTRSRQLLAGTLGDAIFRLQVRAQNEDVDVTKLYISATGNVTSIDRLELYKDGSTTAFAAATISGAGSDPVPAGYTTFVANMQNGQLVVRDGENLDILVKPRMKSDEQGALPGEAVKLNLVVAAGFQPVLARGWISSNTLLANDGDLLNEGEVFVGVDTVGANAPVIGNPNVVVGSKFTVFANANPDADNTNVPTGISPFFQVKVTAASNSNTLNGLNKAALESFQIFVNATNVSLDASSFKLYNKVDSSTKVNVQAFSPSGLLLTGPATGQMMVRVTGLSTSAIDAIFESGESSTLVLEANILNAKVNAAQASALQGSLDLTDAFFSWYDQDTRRTLIRGVEYGDTVVRSTAYRS